MNLMQAMEKIQSTGQKKPENQPAVDYSAVAKKNALAQVQEIKAASKENDDVLSNIGSEDGPVQEKYYYGFGSVR